MPYPIFRNKYLSTSSFIAVTLVSTLLFSCGDKAKPQEETAPLISDSLLKVMHFDTVSQQPLVDAINLSGSVNFDQDNVVEVYPLVSGNIQGITVKLGDYVQKGQVLGEIRSTEIAGFSNDLTTAKTNLNLAEKNWKVAQDMYKSGLSSISDYTAAQTAYKQAQAAVSHINVVANINGSSGSGTNAVIKAPISGFIVEKFINNNMAIRPDNSGPLFTISDLKNVWVMANVYESNIGKIKIGAQAQVTTLSYPDQIFEGKVNEMMNVLDSSSRVMKVKIQLPNPDYKLKPLMFASVKLIEKEPQQALAVSSHSIIFDNSQYYVLVYKSRNEVKITPVNIISRVGGIVYISSGVKPGDVLVATDALMIYQELNS